MPSTTTSMLNGLSTSVAVKAPCVDVETSNITLSGLQGYTEGDRVLVVGQTDATENGIYIASSGSWSRAPDADGNRDLVSGTLVLVQSLSDGVGYELTTADPIVIGTSNLVFAARDIDSSLRGDLSVSSGSSLVGFIASGVGAVIRTILAKLRDQVSVIDYGATSGGNATTNRAAIQAALDAHKCVFIPDGDYEVNGSIYLNDKNHLKFASRGARLWGNITQALVVGKDTATTRRYRCKITSGTLDCVSRSNAGSIGIDLQSMSMMKVQDTEITNCAIGVRGIGYNYGLPNETGCFYNEFRGVDILTVGTGYDFGQLANSNTVHGGRVNDCTYGTRDNDNTCNTYSDLKIESFSTYAHWNSDTTVSILTRYKSSRVENHPVGVGTGFKIAAAAQDIYIEAPYFTGLVTDIDDLGQRTSIVGASEYFKIAGGSRYRVIKTVSVTHDVASIATTVSRQEGPFTVSGARVGDCVSVTLPATWPNGLLNGACIVTANDTVYFNIYNPTGGSIDPSSGDFIFQIMRTVA